MARLRPNLQLQKSAIIGSILLSDASNEAVYFPPGVNGSVLSVVAGIPAYTTLSPASFLLTDGTTSQTITSGDTLTITAGNGMRAVVSATDILTLSSKLSTDANNSMSFGTDGGLYLNAPDFLTGVTWNDVTNQLIFSFNVNGAIVNTPVDLFDLVGTFLSDFTIAANTGTADLVNNHETVSFLGGVGVTTAVSGNTITITADNAKQTFTALATGATVTLAVVPGKTTLVTRNGLEQEITVDYSVLGAVYTFTTAFGISTGGAGTETVVVTYEVA